MNTKTVKYNFQQKLPNGNYVLDYSKISKAGFPVNIIITERGAKGKTFNAKEFALDEFKKHSYKSVWLMNTVSQIDYDKPKFLKNNRKVFGSRWMDVEQVGNNIYYKEINHDAVDELNLAGKPVDINDSSLWTKKVFFELMALSTSEKAKGSRDSDFKYVFYDEFNVGLDQIGNKQTAMFEGLLSTLNDIQDMDNELQVFIHGNNKSLNTPLLVDYKIFAIEDEITTIYSENGKPLILIYKPIIDRAIVESQFENDWTYQLGKRSGNAEHIFMNESLNDEMNGIAKLDSSVMTHITYYRTDGRFYKLSQSGSVFYLEKYEGTPSGNITAGSKKDLEFGYSYSPDVKKVLLELLKKSKIIFDSVATKMTMLTKTN